MFCLCRSNSLNTKFSLDEKVRSISELILHDAPSYLDFLSLLGNSRLVLTDSGGVQQEACILKKPCVTVRENSEWTETLEIGANMLAGTDPEKILQAAQIMIRKKGNWDAPFGDGKTSGRILDICMKSLK